jgi:phytoene desaturase
VGVSEAQGTPRVVVVGAGFGGLAAAIRLQARGFRVTLVDKRDAAGGRAYVYRDAGFAFDGGPTVVTAPFVLDELFSLAGVDMAERLKLVPVDPFYRVKFSDGRVFDYTGDGERMAAEVAKFSPDDVDGYQKFVKAAEEIFKVGFEDLADQPFLRFMDMVRIVPQMMRLKSHLSVFSLVKSFMKDPAVRTVMSFHPLLVGGNPFSTTSIYALIAFLERKWGVWFALGGTGAIVQALVDLFVQLGGELRFGTEVDQLAIERRGGRPKVTGVRLKGGATIAADLVVCNADPPAVYKYLVDPQFRRKNTDKRIDKLRYSMGLVVAYFGTKRTYPDQAHHTILLGPRYEELLDDIFEKKVLAEDFSLYLHAPTRTDPTLAPPGCENFYVLAPVPHLDSGTDWSKEEPAFVDKLYAHLEQRGLTDLRANLVTSRVITPQHFKDELNSERGAAFSIQPTLRQSAYFRFHNRSQDIDDLYFVGAGTHPGAGLPGVISSAKVVDRLIPNLPGTGNPKDPIAATHA